MIPVARPLLGDEEITAALEVLRSGLITQGPQVDAFEDEFAALVDGRHCVAVSSGTAALHLTLLALGIGPGDEVIVPAFTFAATAGAIALAGATPAYADIDPVTYCLDPAAASAAVTPRTAAIIPVHLYGHPAPMGAFTALGERHGLAVIEDACQAHGAELHGRPAGSFGTAAAFSFYPTKNMAAPEGGLVATADAGLARRLRLLRNQGMESLYQHEIIGTNARMTDLAAAIARQQLAKLGGFTEARRRNAAALDTAFTGTLPRPRPAPGARHVYHQYTIRVPGGPAARDAFAQTLSMAGVGTRVFYPVPVHRLPAFRPPKLPDLPHTDAAAGSVLSLPVHPALTGTDIDRITTAVLGAYKEIPQ